MEENLKKKRKEKWKKQVCGRLARQRASGPHPLIHKLQGWHPSNLCPSVTLRLRLRNTELEHPVTLISASGKMVLHFLCLKDTQVSQENRLLIRIVIFAVVQVLSHAQLFATPWTAAHQTPLPFTISRIYSNSCSLSQWCYLTISSPATPFSSFFQSFPTSGSLPMTHIRWPKY